MNPEHEDDIDALLRQSFAGPTADGGFSDRVMQRLPARRRRSAWPLVAGVLAGAGLCAASLYASPLARAAWQGWQAGEWSDATLAMLATTAVMSLLAVAWSVAEADDH